MLTKRSLVISVLFLLVLGAACGSMNRVTPAGMDDKAIEADVRSKIGEAVPNKMFAVEVNVNSGVVTLSGHAKNEDDRRAIGDAANSVHGVKSVINNITIEP
jgi:osmotically-inducible protein OsmY